MNENLSLTHEELLICERLRSLRMSGMADAFESQMLDPNADLAPFIERFTEIVNHEWQIRYDKKFKRYLKQAHLRYPDADLDETIYDPARKLDTDAIERLATCHWIDEGKNLLITGMTSSGKTHLSNALCISALRQLKTVRYIRANTLMLELEQARLKSTYLEYVTALSKLDLLAIDAMQRATFAAETSPLGALSAAMARPGMTCGEICLSAETRAEMKMRTASRLLPARRGE